MFEDIEKAFDAAFFNADHQLKHMNQIIGGIEDVVLSEDLSAALSGAMSTLGTQLSTMAFCFAQLMCKSILYSENYFILKERFQQLQLENFNYKSDKYFMDFVRKLNLICSGNCSSKTKSDAKKAPVHESSNGSLLRSPYPKRRTNRERTSSSSSPAKFNRSKVNKETSASKANRNKSKDGPVSIYSPPKDGQLKLEDSLLNNGNRRYLANSATFRMHRLNNNAFKLIYRNFKEVELINELNFKNVSLQKEVVMLKSELANYRLVARYLNNQMSGRIQQIQLLTREKRDANFETVWGDLESEIQLNKFKTIAQALTSNQPRTVDSTATLLSLLHATSVPSSPSIIRPKVEVTIDRAASPSLDSDVSLLEVDSTTSEIDVNAFGEEDAENLQLRNFKPSWFNVGLLRFVFVNLLDEAIGISVIGGKEYGLPIIISEIHPKTPASRAALQPGEIILSINCIDFTDMKHDEAVALLRDLSGNTRFGVIYFKPDEPRYQQPLASWSALSSMHLPPADWQSGPPSLVDVPQLLDEYYRSVFNTFLSAPLTFQSDQSSQPSSAASDDDEEPDIQSSCSQCSLADETPGQRRPDGHLVSHKEMNSQVASSRVNRPSQISSALVDRLVGSATDTSGIHRKAFPGMAARLSSAVLQL